MAVGGVAAAGAVIGCPAVHAQKPIELTMLDYDTGATSGTLTQFVQDFMKENPGIHITRQTVPQNQYQNTLLQCAAAGQPADILDIDGPMTPALADAGVLSPIDGLLQGFDVDKLFFPGPLSAARWKNKLYGLPFGNNAEVLIYNKKLLGQAQVAVPTTQAELLAAAGKLTKSGVFGFCTSAYGGEECTWNWLPYFWNRGGQLSDLHSQAAVDALAYWGGLVRKGYSPVSELSWQSNDIEPRFINGQIATAMIGSWQLRSLDKNAKAAGLDYGIAVLPSAMKSGDKPIVPFGGEILAIGSTTPKKAAAAWKFIKWVQEPSNLLPFLEQASYVPAYIPVAKPFLANKDNQLFAAVLAQMPNSRSRTAALGANYYDVSGKITVAIQNVMTGASTAKSALAGI